VPKTNATGIESLARDRFQLADLDGAREPVGLALVEAPRPDLDRGGRACRDRRPKRILGRIALEVSREERRHQHVP
jgi:hypothetical protein